MRSALGFLKMGQKMTELHGRLADATDPQEKHDILMQLAHLSFLMETPLSADSYKRQAQEALYPGSTDPHVLRLDAQEKRASYALEENCLGRDR